MTVLDQIAVALGVSVVFVIILLLWSFVWKAYALWRAGRNNHPIWFLFILFLNTLGILPLIYLICFQPKRKVIKKKVRRYRGKF